VHRWGLASRANPVVAFVGATPPNVTTKYPSLSATATPVAGQSLGATAYAAKTGSTGVAKAWLL